MRVLINSLRLACAVQQSNVAPQNCVNDANTFGCRDVTKIIMNFPGFSSNYKLSF